MRIDDCPLTVLFVLKALVASGARISKLNRVLICSLLVGLASCPFLCD
jgi:hypothetical protein